MYCTDPRLAELWPRHRRAPRTPVQPADDVRAAEQTMVLSRLTPLMDLRRPARDARPSGRRDARRVAGWLRRAVARATDSRRLVRRSGLLLCDRVVAVQAELLQIADLLERAERPDAEAVTAVRRLLTDGLQSPLFNRDVHRSELLATLYFVRSRLADDVVVRRLDRHELEA